MKCTLITTHKYQLLAIGTQARGYTIIATKCNPLGITPCHRHAVDLWATSTIRGKVNKLSIGGKYGFGINAAAAGQAPRHTSAISSHQINLRNPILREHHCQLFAIGRPSRGAVIAFVIGDNFARAGGQHLHHHNGAFQFKGNIGHAGAVRRPTR